MKGVQAEGIAPELGGKVRPVALAIDGRQPLARASGLSATDMLAELMSGSETGGDLVCVRIDYLAALVALGANEAVARALWAGDRATIGDYEVNLVPALCLWIRGNGRTIRVNDVQRWIPPDPDEAATIFPSDAAPPAYPERWKWTEANYADAVTAAEQAAAWASALAGEIDAALGRAGLPRYWRDGTGRVAGAVLDRIADLSDIQQPPGVLTYAIATGYVGGRVSIFQAGRYDRITQVDLRSAYPWAMTTLPSLAGATWVRKRQYDPSDPRAIWRVSWRVPHGAVSGPLPVRTANNAIVYPLAGDGWYWSDEVTAALECYGPGYVTPTDGYALRTASDRTPFAGLADYYAARRALQADGDTAAAHVAKLGLTSCYGRIAQMIRHNGQPGRWGNLALAGMTTAAVRARMMRTLWEHETTAIALATDSLTVAGDADTAADTALGGWSVETGGDALMLPSGVFRVASGDAAMDRAAGVERSRAMLIQWDDLYHAWDVLGLALRYTVKVPRFTGLGVAGASDKWGRFGHWRVQKHEIVGSPHNAQALRTAPRVWRFLPTSTKPVRANVYVPRAGTLGKLDDQGNRTVSDTAREHDQPFT